LIATIGKVTEKEVGVGEVAVRHPEDDAARAGNARFSKVAFEAGRVTARAARTSRQRELNKTRNAVIVDGQRRVRDTRELRTFGSVRNVWRAVRGRNARDNEALRGWRRARGRRRRRSAG